MSDNKQKPTPSASLQQPTTSKAVKKPATPKPLQQKALRSAKPKNDSADDNALSHLELELECDFVYSQYLRIIITNEMIEEKVQRNIVDMFDQLSQQMEVLQNMQAKQFQLEKEVRVQQVKLEIQRVFKILKATFSEVKTILEEYNVDQNLNECLKAGEQNASKVYLKSITPMKDSEEYSKLLALITECTKSLENFQKAAGNKTEVQLLRDNVVEYNKLFDTFQTKRRVMFENQQMFIFNAFKIMSDQLAEKFK